MGRPYTPRVQVVAAGENSVQATRQRACAACGAAVTHAMSGREAIVAFLARKWARELDYRLIKELWAFREHRIAVRFAYEWRDDSSHWFRSYGNENWEFDAGGFMSRRIASINDLPIAERDRLFRWPAGRRPDDHPGLSELGL